MMPDTTPKSEARDPLREILRKVRDAGALDDNNGAEDWTHSDAEIEKAAQLIDQYTAGEKVEARIDEVKQSKQYADECKLVKESPAGVKITGLHAHARLNKLEAELAPHKEEIS